MAAHSLASGAALNRGQHIKYTCPTACTRQREECETRCEHAQPTWQPCMRAHTMCITFRDTGLDNSCCLAKLLTDSTKDTATIRVTMHAMPSFHIL